MQKVACEIRDSVFIIKLTNPPLNVLSDSLRQSMFEAINLANSNDAIKAIVIHGGGKYFCGGADIKEFGQSPLPPSLPEVITAIENSTKPVIAALHGVAFGGGLELPLGCNYRIGVTSLQVGLPEVNLGLIPGAGGTQRLPRLIGVEQALSMIISGKPVMAKEALSLGILDALVDKDRLLEESIIFALARAKEGGPFNSLRNLTPANPDLDLFKIMRKKFGNRMRGLIAPWHCIKSIEDIFLMTFDEGLLHERELFLECRASDQSAGQRHIFFAERNARKILGIVREKSQKTIKSAAVVGCGTMGADIAVCIASAGISVKIVDKNTETLEKGLKRVNETFARLANKNDFSELKMNSSLSLIKGTTDLGDIRDVDIVIEAVFEEMDLKKEIFVALDKICKADCILATNTSTLDVDEIASKTKRPDRVIGMHFLVPHMLCGCWKMYVGKKLQIKLFL